MTQDVLKSSNEMSEAEASLIINQSKIKFSPGVRGRIKEDSGIRF